LHIPVAIYHQVKALY